MTKTLTIGDVVEGGLCTGCGICQAMNPQKVKVALNSDGYLRPNVQSQFTQDENSAFANVCPGLLLKHDGRQNNYHRHWGPLIDVRTGHATDGETRHVGSSGGVLSALLIYLLESKLVDFVVHVKVARDDPLGNEVSISRTREEVLSGAGSRYAPSAPLTQLNELLNLEGKFVFIGKPCDVAAINNFKSINQKIREKIPFVLSFMCAGIPSRKGTLEILKKFEIVPEQVKSFSYRGNGWPGKTTAITNDDKKFETDYATSWGAVLNRHLQFRCKICPDGIGEFADVVGADAWYGKDGYPDFAEQEGRSLILSRTTSGEKLLCDAEAAGYLALQKLDVVEIQKMQPYQLERKRSVFSRILALRILGRPAPRYVYFPLFRL